MKININISIDLKEDKMIPKVEVVAESNENPEEIVEVRGSDLSPEPEQDEVQPITNPNIDFKPFKADFSSLRLNYDYETLEAYSQILPTIRFKWNGVMKIWKLIKRLGLIKNGKEFIDFYNAGWVTLGKKNSMEHINAYTCDLALFFSSVAWKDERMTQGYMLIQIRDQFGLIEIERIRERGGLRETGRF